MNAKQVCQLAVSGRGRAMLVVGLLGLGALEARADNYTTQIQLLVTGTQRPDPQQPDGLHFVQDGSAWVSTIGMFRESSAYSVSVLTGTNGVQTTIIRGHILDTAPNKDEILYRFRGTITLLSRVGVNPSVQLITGNLTIIGGTGQFSNAWGGGKTTCVVYSDGRFSSRSDVTINIPFER